MTGGCKKGRQNISKAVDSTQIFLYSIRKEGQDCLTCVPNVFSEPFLGVNMTEVTQADFWFAWKRLQARLPFLPDAMQRELEPIRTRVRDQPYHDPQLVEDINAVCIRYTHARLFV